MLKNFIVSADLLVLIDLTGGYEKLVVSAFYKAGFNICLAQGRKVRQFSAAFGQKAKTDVIDAKMLTIYGAKMQETLRLYKPSNEILKELISRRQELLDMLQKENNRKEHFTNKTIKRSLNSTADFLKKQIELIEKEIKEHIDKDKQLKAKSQIINSITSVGNKTTLILIASLPELGQANRRQIAALTGLAPFANDSGISNKRRTTRHGRRLVKRTLFMCALSAVKYHSTLKAFYEKLIANGKQKMLALVALMRKLLIIINNSCKSLYLQNSFTNV